MDVWNLPAPAPLTDVHKQVSDVSLEAGVLEGDFSVEKLKETPEALAKFWTQSVCGAGVEEAALVSPQCLKRRRREAEFFNDSWRAL